ncbi:hypothetical protein QW694_22150 [Methylobacterium isbiliense]|jgi:hypothetical protein|nr:hypothetical protein [Methylobacterium isbiliense]MDN3625739.1 hypothetical protein [Methylobacterium isbiliense]
MPLSVTAAMPQPVGRKQTDIALREKLGLSLPKQAMPKKARAGGRPNS